MCLYPILRGLSKRSQVCVGGGGGVLEDAEVREQGLLELGQPQAQPALQASTPTPVPLHSQQPWETARVSQAR